MKTVIILFFVIWCGAAALAAGVIIACGLWYITFILAILFCVGLGYAVTAVKAVNAPTEFVPEVDVEADMKILRLEIQQFNDNGIIKPKSYHNIDITIILIALELFCFLFPLVSPS